MSTDKKTLILGASTNTERYAHRAAISLLAHNHAIEMLGRRKGKIQGNEIDDKAQFYDDIDTVTLYLGPKNQVEYYQYLIALAPKRVIFNPGTENPELCQLLKKNNIECVEACTLVLLSIGNY